MPEKWEENFFFSSYSNCDGEPINWTHEKLTSKTLETLLWCIYHFIGVEIVSKFTAKLT